MFYNINLTDKCNLNCKHCFANKTSLSMSDETLELVFDFLQKRLSIDDKNELSKTIQFLGGELGLFDPKKILHLIIKIKALDVGKDIYFNAGTNLIYELTPEHISLFKALDELTTSFDYGIRFNNLKQELLWFKNLEILKKENINLNCHFCVTNSLIKNITPRSFIDFILALGLKRYHLMILSKPVTDIKNYDKPLNREADDWLFETFLLYEELKALNVNIHIELFECIKEAVKGNCYSDFQRCCQTTNLTITPDGNVSQCAFTVKKPYYNLYTKQLNLDNYKYWKNIEDNIPQACLKCSYYKYCHGNCCLCEWDESGCPSQIKIFKYLVNKNE